MNSTKHIKLIPNLQTTNTFIKNSSSILLESYSWVSASPEYNGEDLSISGNHSSRGVHELRVHMAYNTHNSRASLCFWCLITNFLFMTFPSFPLWVLSWTGWQESLCSPVGNLGPSQSSALAISSIHFICFVHASPDLLMDRSPWKFLCEWEISFNILLVWRKQYYESISFLLG